MPIHPSAQRLLSDTLDANNIASRITSSTKVILNQENSIDALRTIAGACLTYRRPLDPVGLEDWEVLKEPKRTGK